MRFSTSSDNLYSALHMVSGMVPSRAPLPILSGVLMETNENNLKLTATDLEQGIQTSIPVNVEEPGEIVIPSRQVIELLRRLSGIDVTVETNSGSNVTTISYFNSSFSLHGFPPEEYPSLPEFTRQNYFHLSQSLLRKMLRQVLHAVATEEHRPIFTGVLFEISEDRLNLVATDTRRLSIRSTALDEQFNELINLVVPGKTLNELVKLLTNDESTVHIYFTANHMYFFLDEVQVVTRLLKGEYPNYKMAIPSNITSNVKFNTIDLLDAVDRALLLSSPSKQTLILQLQDNTLTVLFNSEKGNIREDIEVENDGKNMDVGFNGRYLKEGLRAIDSEQVYFQLTGPSTPALLKPIGDENYISLLVPASPGSEDYGSEEHDSERME